MMLEEAPKAPTRPALRLRDCYAFFGPLVLMVELNMISKSVIHAFLARTDTPSITLAAFNAAFTFYFALASATEVTTLLCLSYLKARSDFLRLIGFMAIVLIVPLAVALATIFTDFGHVVFGGWFGLGEEAQIQARAAVAALVTSIPILLLRGTAFSLLMLNRKTIIITLSTLVRLLSLTVSLLLLPRWLDGAVIGAAALVGCMAAETIFGWLFAWRLLRRLPALRESRETFRGYWRFSWPLIVNGSAEMGVIFVTTLFLGRLSQAELAIAAFGVVHGLVSLLMAPMRNLTQSAQTLVARREDVRIMLVFTGQLVVGFSLLAIALFWTSLSDVILLRIMALTPELAAYSAPALILSFVLAPFWSTTALFRGLLAKARSTGSLAASGVLRILSAMAAGSVALVLPGVNGAVLGVAAWILSYAVEAAISTWRLRRLGWYAAVPETA
jgi:O-antigen/teichoic acid export membrane protein